MPILRLFLLLVFALTFLVLPRLGGGWFWDFGNGLGLVAFVGLLFQMIPCRRGKTLKRHEWLGYAVLGLSFAHAGWLLTGDPAVRFYLLPGAPLYMWLGLAALVLLAALTLLARMPERKRLHRGYTQFRQVHRWLGFALVLAAALHILLSGFYLRRWWQGAALIALTLAASLGRSQWARLGTPPPAASARAYLALGSLALAAFLLIRDLVP